MNETVGESAHEDLVDITVFDEFINLDHSPDEPVLDNDIRYLSEADQNQILEVRELNGDWNDRKISTVGEPIHFSLDTARKDAWKLFVDEIDHIKSTIPSLLKSMDPLIINSSNHMSHLFCLAFGEKSDVSMLLCKELQIDRDTFCRFLGTLCLQMSYHETPAALFDKLSQLKKSVLMEETQYLEIWRTIATKKQVSLRKFVGTSRREQCLWEMMESTVNNFLRSISVSGRTDEINIALDDDKIWVESSGKNQDDDFGLRKVTHVKDNRKGIVAHTAVSSTTNLPLCFLFERKGDNAVDCFKRIFGHLFPSSNPSHLPDLNGVTNHSDRAYTIESTIFKFLLPAGADFTNTVKQIMPFPFYWSAHPSGSNDPRQKLNEKGAPTLFIKEMLKENRMVSCNAFRTGTQNISTTISTVIHGHQWEGFCANQKQRLAYENDPLHGLDHLLFERLAELGDVFNEYEEKINDLLEELTEEKINVLTLEQGTADWHKGRQFSLTSSQSDASFRMAFIVNQTEDSWCDTAEYLFGQSYHTHLSGAVPRESRCMLIQNNNQEQVNQQGEDVPQEETPPDLEQEPEPESEKVQDQQENNPVVAMINYFKSLQNTQEILASPEKVEALGIIVDRLSHDPDGSTPVNESDEIFSRAKAKIRKEILGLLSGRIPLGSRLERIGISVLKKWLGSSNNHRSFMFLSKDAMCQKAATEAGIRIPIASVDKMVEKLVELLLQQLQQQYAHTDARTNTCDGGADGGGGARPGRGARRGTTRPVPPCPRPDGQEEGNPPHEDQVMTISKEITKALLQKSFMKPLKGQRRDYCQMGHKLELPIGIDWMNDVNKKKLFPGFKVVSLHKIGLVAKQNHPWAKDSIDFIAFVLDEHKAELQLWGVEVKSRHTPTTISEEKEFNRKLHRSKYQIISSAQAHKYVRKVDERFQVLHHSFVYGLERVILLVANNAGKIISGTVVEYSDEICEAYEKVVERLKEMSLEWAYENFDDEESIKNIVLPNDVLSMSQEIQTINGTEAIYGAVKLWRVMFSNPAVLPRPPMLRIIPATHAQWNSTKGGSDTVTKMADDCFAKPPRNLTNFESVAFCRCISNLLITIQKLYHALSAKNDVADKYPSMQHYRNAASHRLTYKQLLRQMYKMFKDEVEQDFDKENENAAGEDCTHRVRRAKAKGTDTVPDQASFMTNKTFKTPTKARRKQIEKGTVCNAILNRVRNCPGNPIEIVQQKEGIDKDPRRECYICSTKTPWQCSKCRLYFCMSYKETKKRKEQLYYVREKVDEGSKSKEVTKIYGKSCFHVGHEAALTCSPINEAANNNNEN